MHRARVSHAGRSCALLCLLAIPLAACSLAAPRVEPVTLVFLYRDDFQVHVETLIDRFQEQFPHVTVDLRPTDMGTLAWDVDAQSGDVREVFTAIVDREREEGDLMALDPFIDADPSFGTLDVYPALLEAMTIDGQTWAVPYGVSPAVVYYNQDLFDQRDVPYPQVGWTWDDFAATAIALRDPEAGIYGYARPDGTRMFLWSLIYQHGGRVIDNVQLPTGAAFQDPLTIEAMAWYARLIHDQGAAPTTRQVQTDLFDDVDVAFHTGKVAMITRALSLQGGRDATGTEWPMRWGIATAPRSPDGPPAPAGDLWINAYAISSQTQHPVEAWQLVAFLSQQMPDRQLPVRLSHVESEEYGQLVGDEVVAVTRDVLAQQAPMPTRRFLDTTLLTWGILSDAAARIESGHMTAEEAMQWAQQEAEARIGP